jgi:hypothetical protein
LSTYLFSFVLYGSIAVVKGKDEQAHGAYRTKRVILAIYDAIQQAMEVGNHITCASTHPCIRLDTAGNHAGGGNGTTYKKA